MYGWGEEVDEEESDYCSVKLHELPETDLDKGHDQTETDDRQDIEDFFFVDAQTLGFLESENRKYAFSE